MTGNIYMPNLIQAIFDKTKCDDDAGPICDLLQLSDIKLLQPSTQSF